jgi:hypothetical protein
MRPWSHDPASLMAGVSQPAPRPDHGAAREHSASGTNPTPGRQISYDAPSGFHDDSVVALALANEARIQGGAPAPMVPLAAARPASVLRS